ncbi:MAG: formyl transferase [Bacteroidota bacterium]|nr:formyl transferase [Bacteroidota bacterium]
MRVVIITSTGLRHKYYCSSLAQHLDIAGIITEEKAPIISSSVVLSEEGNKIIKAHLNERDEVEKQLLGNPVFPGSNMLNLRHGECNSAEVLRWIDQKKPDVILLYGSSIIKDPVLSAYDNKIINLHLGLSPYYRGSATNFWPLVYNEPECVGATIHLATLKVDAGSILFQVRPVPAASDRAHHLGTKTIIEAVNTIPAVLSKYMGGGIDPQVQQLEKGRVFRMKDFNADAVIKMWQNFEEGMMQAYMSDMDRRLERYPIVSTI